MGKPRVLIAGGGIGGLSAALTLNQIGVDCVVFESVRELKPLGVGINIQPNAVRELYDMGITESDMDRVGVKAREWALVGLNGNDIYAEPRGEEAGYHWPQYAVHRGEFHMLLHDKFVERAGKDAVRLGAKVTGYENNADGSVTALIEHADGTTSRETGSLLIAADGIHSALRAQMHPEQPPIHWGGAIMWRGTTRAKPIRTGSSFIGLGTHQHRMVIYPISAPDADGLATINWIAEMTLDASDGWQSTGWFRPVEIEEFAENFEAFKYDWLDVPDMLRNADVSYENPMIDREPVETWVDGGVALMGDAAHAMYPTGS
ncbi:MAG: FAD-dependent monooxygenase, partial [Maritimibacter sp.]